MLRYSDRSVGSTGRHVSLWSLPVDDGGLRRMYFLVSVIFSFSCPATRLYEKVTGGCCHHVRQPAGHGTWMH